MAVFAIGCSREEPASDPAPQPRQKGSKLTRKSPSAAAGDADANCPAAPWATKPKDQWPQIVLTNHAEFHGHTPLQGASAFLFRAPDHGIMAATARHLIGENGGVEPEIALPDFNKALDFWVMHPRTLPEKALQIASLASPHNAPKAFDWLLLNVAHGSAIPVTAVDPRPTPVKIGERVHLIGVSYDEPDVAQKVYTGKVTRREADRFAYDLETPVNIRGFSGAPIVDDSGRLVGIMTVWFEPRMDGDFYLEAGGEDAATLLLALKEMIGARK